MLTSIFLCLTYFILAFSCEITERDYEEEKNDLIRDIIVSCSDRKGWRNFLVVGNWPDAFFKKIQDLPQTYTVVNDAYKGYTIKENLKYPAKTLMIDSVDFDDFEKNMNIARNIPYWHPHANTIVYLHNATESKEIIAQIFFSLWYCKSSNAIIVQYSDASETLMITYFNPYISESYTLKQSFGCWTDKRITYPVTSFKKGLICTEGCHNVSIHSKLRSDHLGTCIGFETITIPYRDNITLKTMQLFEDKAKNLHGFVLRAYVKEVLPFTLIDDNKDGTYTLHQRDGFIWTTMAERMNFAFDFSPSIDLMKGPFDFEETIQQIYDFAQRKGDLQIMPVYQFDLVIVEIDMTIPFEGSGVCFVSHRAGFDTTLFDVKLLQTHYALVMEFVFCFVGIWLTFFVFKVAEKGYVNYDQAGKDFVNAFRSILSVSLYNPPKKELFKIFLLISIWSFFVMNFATQAAIISFFSAFKRGREVETFDDVIEKGYIIEGMASPDIMLPETEEKFRKINAKLVPIQDLFACVERMVNDSHRFCLVDCSVGRYLARNKLNDEGEQYLHIAKDQVHNNYLNMIFQKNSPFTDEYNRNMLRFLQAGLIKKWQQYRYTDIKFEAPVKSLGMDDLIGIFKCYFLLVGLSVATFVAEVTRDLAKIFKNCIIKLTKKRKRTS